MSSPNEPMRLEHSDLYSAEVESYLQVQEALQRGVPEIPPQPLIVRIIYSSYFYLSLAGAFGAFCAWLMLEPFVDDNEPANWFDLLLMFPIVVGLIGLFIGAVDGIMCRNPQRALICAVVGLGIGFGAGLIVNIPAEIIFNYSFAFAVSLNPPREGARLTGIALLILMMGRGACWAITAIPTGVGQGIALREKKVILNGLLGGVLGGLLGGLLFDPIFYVFTTEDGQAAMSRAIGFVAIGFFVGLFVGLVEQWTKSAWLLMQAGPLAGKQFILFRNPTVLGSSPKADVYLFKDEAIEPQHALIHNRGGRFEIEDRNTPDGTYVNGIPIKKQLLQSGDKIVLGKTVLEFLLKEAK